MSFTRVISQREIICGKMESVIGGGILLGGGNLRYISEKSYEISCIIEKSYDLRNHSML